MQDFCVFTRKILHIITSKPIDLSVKGLTAPLLQFLKSLPTFIYKEFAFLEKLSYHLVTTF